jgi:hypothetical protein
MLGYLIVRSNFYVFIVKSQRQETGHRSGCDGYLVNLNRRRLLNCQRLSPLRRGCINAMPVGGWPPLVFSLNPWISVSKPRGMLNDAPLRNAQI